MKTILIAVDFSDQTERVLSAACDLATRADEVRLIVLAVTPLQSLSPEVFGVAQFTNTTLLGDEYAAEALRGIAARLRADGFTVLTHHLVGDPGPAIVECATGHHCDYIVMGSHGHGAVRHALMGSVTLAVINHARCPVLIIPTSAKNPTGST